MGRRAVRPRLQGDSTDAGGGDAHVPDLGLVEADCAACIRRDEDLAVASRHLRVNQIILVVLEGKRPLPRLRDALEEIEPHPLDDSILGHHHDEHLLQLLDVALVDCEDGADLLVPFLLALVMD